MKSQDLMVKASGVNLHVVDYGGEGETILLIHGFTTNARCWDAIAERLIEVYHVVAFDIRGRGESERPEQVYYDTTQYAEDAKSILDYYKRDKAIIMGHSIGVVFANSYPDRLSKLILIDGGIGISDPRAVNYLLTSLERIDKLYPNFQTYIEENKQNPHFTEWNEYIENYLRHDMKQLENGTLMCTVAKHAVYPSTINRKVDLDELNLNIKVPTLIMQAPYGVIEGEDAVKLFSPEKGKHLADLLPEGSRYVEIKDANHYSIIFNKYEEVIREVIEFLHDTNKN